MRIYRITFFSWCVAIGCLLLVFVFTTTGATADGREVLWPLAMLLFFAAFLVAINRAIVLTLRSSHAQRAESAPCELERLVRDLDMDDDWTVRHALQTLSDVWDHPFGPVDCWLLWRLDGRQLRNLAALYKDWHQSMKEACLEDFSRRISQRLRELDAERQDERSRAASVSMQVKLPLMAVERFAEEMRDRVNVVLQQVAIAINDAPSGEAIPDAARHVRDRFDSLWWDALKTGLDLRMRGVPEWVWSARPRVHNGGTLVPRTSLELEEVQRVRVYQALQALATVLVPEEEELPHALCKEVGEHLSALWMDALELGTQMRLDAADIARAFENMKPRCVSEERVRSTPCPQDQPPRPGKFAALFDDLADSVRDALLDFEMVKGEETEAPSDQALPPLVKHEFVAQARTRLDEVLDQMGDAINESATAQELDDCDADVQALFKSLGHDLLEIGVQMRIDAALAGVAVPPTAAQPVSAAPKALVNKVAVAPLPRKKPNRQKSWVEKYRRMKIREGKWPPVA